MGLASSLGIHVFATILGLAFTNTVGATTIQGGADGFSMTMIPTYSKNSPISPGNLTDEERYALMLQSSDRYAKRLAAIASNNADSHLDSVTPIVNQALDSHYIVQVGIGTPPSRFVLQLDTGSNLIWVQCLGCSPCFPIRSDIHLFDHEGSSTYQVVPCADPSCVPHTCEGDKCTYQMSYYDSSESNGTRSVDTFMVYSHDPPGNVNFNHMKFGCGLQNKARWGKNTGPGNIIAGLFGMGRGVESFISQLMARGIPGKFSYCLNNWKTAQGGLSLLRFGSSSSFPPGATIYTTPLINGPVPDYYYVNLFRISVDGVDLNFPPDLFLVRRDNSGGMVLDTGARVTYLYADAFWSLVERLTEIFERAGLEQAQVESGWWSDLKFCWVTKQGFEFPKIVFHFQGDAIFEPDPEAIFVIFLDVFCLQIRSSNSIAILGAFTMTNFMFQTDITRRSVSFAKKDCTHDME